MISTLYNKLRFGITLIIEVLRSVLRYFIIGFKKVFGTPERLAHLLWLIPPLLIAINFSDAHSRAYGLIIAVLSLIAIIVIFPRVRRFLRNLGPEYDPTEEMSEEEAFCYPFKEDLLDNENILNVLAPKADFPLYDEDGKRIAGESDLVARRQSASRQIGVYVIPTEDGFSETKFTVTIDVGSRRKKDVVALAEYIVPTLHLRGIKEVDPDIAFVATFECLLVPEVDQLPEMFIGDDFFAKYPAENLKKLPLGLTENLTPWSLPVHHTLCVGLTGSGKGSLVQGIIRQVAPFHEQGLVECYGADPKNAELKPFRNSALFTRVEFEQEAMEEVVQEVHDRMKRRQQYTSRSFTASRQTPLLLLIIDEFSTFMKRASKEAKENLYAILAQGRSDGVYVIAAVQNPDKAILGDIRDNFANVVVLRIDSRYFNSLFLGEEAENRGFRAYEIPTANEANGFKFAGIGYGQDETGTTQYLRLAYTSDEAVDNLVKQTAIQWEGQNPYLATGPMPEVL